MAEALYTVNADVSQRSIAEAHRKWLELNTYLTKSREKAEQQAAEAQQRAEEAQRQAEEAEQKLAKAEAELAKYKEKYGDDI